MGLSNSNTDREEGNKISIRTPLIYSKPLSDKISRNVYLKLENTQPSGSFKLRGIAHLCKRSIENGSSTLIGSSGGNAGLALAYSASKLNAPCKLFVPEYVPVRMLKKFKSYGAEITIVGKDWQETNAEAQAALQKDKNSAFVHPFDDPLVWEGHSAMVKEIKEDLKNVKPACIVTSVGGGGLLCGILMGLEEYGWSDVPVLAMETIGAHCLHESIKAGKIVEFEKLTSVAKTLGARSVASKVMELLPKHNVISEVLEDKEAIRGCIRLADDHGFMVEPSCGVTMASVYSDLLPGVLEKNGVDSHSGPIVLIVCGGSDISHEILKDFAEQFQLTNELLDIPSCAE